MFTWPKDSNPNLPHSPLEDTSAWASFMLGPDSKNAYRFEVDQKKIYLVIKNTPMKQTDKGHLIPNMVPSAIKDVGDYLQPTNLNSSLRRIGNQYLNDALSEILDGFENSPREGLLKLKDFLERDKGLSEHLGCNPKMRAAFREGVWSMVDSTEDDRTQQLGEIAQLAREVSDLGVGQFIDILEKDTPVSPMAKAAIDSFIDTKESWKVNCIDFWLPDRICG